MGAVTDIGEWNEGPQGNPNMFKQPHPKGSLHGPNLANPRGAWSWCVGDS
jgi:hypothetical protein